jgi:hypothetical protein
MAQTAANLVDHVIAYLPVRQWVRSRPIPLRLLLAAQPRLLTPVLQVVHRVLTRHLLGQAGLKSGEADSGAVTLIQRFGCTANLNIHLHCLVLGPARDRARREQRGNRPRARHRRNDGQDPRPARAAQARRELACPGRRYRIRATA